MKSISNLRTGLLAGLASVVAGGAMAGNATIAPPSSGDGSDAGLLVLLVIGALILMNGNSGRGQQGGEVSQDANDDDILMKF